jgi:hypothetical protein
MLTHKNPNPFTLTRTNPPPGPPGAWRQTSYPSIEWLTLARYSNPITDAPHPHRSGQPGATGRHLRAASAVLRRAAAALQAPQRFRLGRGGEVS